MSLQISNQYLIACGLTGSPDRKPVWVSPEDVLPRHAGEGEGTGPRTQLILSLSQTTTLDGGLFGLPGIIKYRMCIHVLCLF